MKKRNLNQAVKDGINLIRYTDKLDHCNETIGQYLNSGVNDLNSYMDLAESVIPTVNGFMMGWLLSRVKDVISDPTTKQAHKHAALLIIFDQYLKQEIFNGK